MNEEWTIHENVDEDGNTIIDIYKERQSRERVGERPDFREIYRIWESSKRELDSIKKFLKGEQRTIIPIEDKSKLDEWIELRDDLIKKGALKIDRD